ncbi:MAG: helix-turn-helix domain-containing protein [Aliishimia sp.]
MTDTIQNQFLNTAQAAHYLGYSTSSLEAWRCDGRGPTYYKMAGRVKYRKSELDAFMEAGRKETRS